MEAVARLRNYPTSPRKMRLLADVIRGMDVEKAVNFLKFNAQHSSQPLEKLLLSAVANWHLKNEGQEDSDLIVKIIFVDCARTIKRMMPAPQGRAHRKLKRSNHVTIIVDQKVSATPTVSSPVTEENN
jgi:large subunit ribosomal protein L22